MAMKSTEKENPQTVEEYMALPYRIELIPSEEGGYVVSMPELPGCLSQGETVEDALEMIRDAQFSWLTVALKHEDTIPLPRGEDYSGRFLVRVPKEVHRDLAHLAEGQDISLNLLVATILARSVGRADPEERRPGRPRKLPARGGRRGLPDTFDDLPQRMAERESEEDMLDLYVQLIAHYHNDPPHTGMGEPMAHPVSLAQAQLAASIQFLPDKSRFAWQSFLEEMTPVRKSVKPHS